MDSDEEIFLTQNKFRESINSGEESESILNDILDLEAEETPHNFDVKLDIFSSISDNDIDKTSMEAQKENQSMDVKRSQEKENTCFGEPISESDFSIKTELKSKWATNLFHSWLRNRREKNGHRDDICVVDGDLLSMDLEALNYSLGVFITEVRKENGGDYLDDTLYEIIIAIQHHLRKNGRFVTLMDDVEFEGMQNKFDKKMKYLAASSIEIERKQSDFITKAKYFTSNSLRAKGTTQTCSEELPEQLGASCTSAIQQQEASGVVESSKQKYETITCDTSAVQID
jgi:hypothetical protein